MWSPSPKNKNSPQPGVFRRTLKSSFSSSTSSKSAASDFSDGETPLVILKVQIIGCTNLPAADLNGKSDPYVVLTFGQKRVKTPSIKRTLNPKYLAKDATFELPIYASEVGRHGAFLDFVVWDKDIIGKDYLAELSLTLNQWYRRKLDNGNSSAVVFDDPTNNPISYHLTSTKYRRPKARDKDKPILPPAIQLKIGLVRTSKGAEPTDLQEIFSEILANAQKAPQNVFSLPPSQALGAAKPAPGTTHRQSITSVTSTEDSSPSSSPIPPPVHTSEKQQFRIDFEGIRVDYDFETNKDTVGILLVEVKQAADLPKVKNFTRIGWDMDPFVVIKYGESLYRTRVIRHDLNPTFNDKFILFMRHSTHDSLSDSGSAVPFESTVSFSLLDWERMTRDNHVGDASLDVLHLMDLAPKPDPETGLYSEEAMRLHGFQELTLNLILDQKKKDRWEGQPSSGIVVRAKYEAHDAMRQRFWRHYLKEYDLDHSGQYSPSDLIRTLDSIGLIISKAKMDTFFASRNKDPTIDELTIEEAMQCLEEEFGTPARVRRERTDGGRPPRRARSSMFGHSRDSIYDLEVQLTEIFARHPQVYYRTPEDEENRNPLVPASAILSILTTFSEMHGLALLEDHEEADLKKLVEGMDNAEIGPDFLITFIAKATGTEGIVNEARGLPEETESSLGPSSSTDDVLMSSEDSPQKRGRSPDHSQEMHSRASSRDSIVTSYRVGQKPGFPSGPAVPTTPKTPSPFDVRQRSTPLETSVPSAWNPRPIPASKRRRSTSSTGSAGAKAMSDGEASPSISHFSGPTRTRARAPSNPVSPPRLPNFTFPPRPPAARSTSPERSGPYTGGSQSTPSLPLSPRGFHSLRVSPNAEKMSSSVQSLPVTFPRRISPTGNPDSMESSRYDDSSRDTDEPDHDGQFDDYLSRSRLESDRTSLFSLASSTSGDRLQDLESQNVEQSRKLQEVERTLEEKVAAHDIEMEEFLVQKEEIAAELESSRRDEKELRLKDLNASKQLTALESEVSHLQRMLETSKAAYQTLQKQYQEQCSEAEKYRESINRKDADLKDSELYLAMSEADVEKWKASAAAAHHAIETLSTALEAARTAVSLLDGHKQENLSLKETIDRLRFELDELRTAAAGHTSSTLNRSGPSTNNLEEEMGPQFLSDQDDQDDSESEVDTAVGSEQGDDDDYVETVITRRKKVAKGSNPAPEDVHIVKEYADAETQHIYSDFVSHVSSQTIPVVRPETVHSAVQVDPVDEVSRTTATASVQTDDGIKSSVHNHGTDSGSIAGPSTYHAEAPPSYSRLLEVEREVIGLAGVSKWHSDLHSTAGLPQGISDDAMEEWERVKLEVGFTCSAIDQVLENSIVRGPRPTAKEPETRRLSSDDFLDAWTIITMFGVLSLLLLIALRFPAYGRALISHDRRMWNICNDISRAGIFKGFGHANPNVAWSLVRRLQPGARGLGWVPT